VNRGCEGREWEGEGVWRVDSAESWMRVRGPEGSLMREDER